VRIKLLISGIRIFTSNNVIIDIKYGISTSKKQVFIKNWFWMAGWKYNYRYQQLTVDINNNIFLISTIQMLISRIHILEMNKS